MEKTQELIKDLARAVERLGEALLLPPEIINQDATIQRFEFTFELSWKTMQAILRDKVVDAYGIRTVIREAARIGIIDDPVVWFKFLEHRNISTHTYKEDEVRSIYKDIKDFPPLVKSLLAKIKDFE